MTIRIKVKRLNPDFEKFTVLLHRRGTAAWNDCIGDFVRAAAPKVHVDTGMSLASLIPLGRIVRALDVLGRSGTGKTRRGYTDIRGIYHPKQLKGAHHGERLGESAYQISYGNSKRPVFRFSFDIRVFQWLLHDVIRGSWGAIEAGRAAMSSSIQSRFKGILPRMQEYSKPEEFEV
jgi:hypothetical protein